MKTYYAPLGMFGCCMLAVARLAGKVGGLTEVFFTGLCGALPLPKCRAAVFLVVFAMFTVFGSDNSRAANKVENANENENATENATENAGIMTLTTNKQSVLFTLKGTGTAIIDFDDGSTLTLELGNLKTDTVRHEYSDSNQRTITISGDNITHFDCRGNQLTALDVSRNTALTYLDCSSNRLTAIDVSRNTALTYLNCCCNQLTALDVSQNTALTQLLCYYNQLTDLNLRRNTALTSLICERNQITALDLSQNTSLISLWCSQNRLTTIDVSHNTALKQLSFNSNQLTALNVSRNTELTGLYIGRNQFTADALNALFRSLPANEQTTDAPFIELDANPGTNDSDRSIIETRGWIWTRIALAIQVHNSLPLVSANEVSRIAPAIKKWTDFYNIDFSQARLYSADAACFNCPPDTTSNNYFEFREKDDTDRRIDVDYSPDKQLYVDLGIRIGLYSENDKHYFIGWDDFQSITLIDRNQKHTNMIFWLGATSLAEAVFWVSNDVFVVAGYHSSIAEYKQHFVRVFDLAKHTISVYEIMSKKETESEYMYEVYLKEKGINVR